MSLSSISDSVTGADTTIDIPINKWTFVTLSFENSTHAQHLNPNDKPASASNYSISVFVNGQLDIAAHYQGSVLANSGDLHVFKDPTHLGPRMFVHDLIIWDAPISASTVLSVYSFGHKQSLTRLIDSALSSTTGSSLLPQLLSSKPSADKPVTATQTTPLRPENRGYILPWESEGSRDEAFHQYDMTRKLLQAAEESFSNCAPMEDRLDRYAEAAWFGSPEALYRWAILLATGTEDTENRCGFDSKLQNMRSSEHDQVRAVYALIRAVESGVVKAIFPLVMMLLSGQGLSCLTYPEESLLGIQSKERSSLDHPKNTGPLAPAPSILSVPVPRDSEKSALFAAIVSIAKEANRTCNFNNEDDPYRASGKLLLGRSTICPQEAPHRLLSALSGSSATDPLTELCVGLLHIAALHRSPEAQASLMYRYEDRLSVEKDQDTAAYYGSLAVTVASNYFHRVGGQPVLEADRLDDHTERHIDKGRAGTDDDIIQHQMIRAEEGDINAMMSTGDLFYFGARGLPRDQARALNYFNRVAATGDAGGLCAAAAMYLKGEGTEKNLTRAIEMFEAAAEKGSVRALNGLGHLYFFGQEIPRNETKAFNYFLSAAETETDADALFNAAYCLHKGIGTPSDILKAVRFYTLSVQKFGHFASATALSTLHLNGEGVPRSSSEAMKYLVATVKMGPWVGWLRRGLDQYLLNQFQRALTCYVLAGDLGYEISQANAAFIIRRKLLSWKTNSPNSTQTYITTPMKRLLLRELALSATLGNKDSMFQIANAFFYGLGVDMSCESSLWWYSKASAQGHFMSSLYLGMFYHFGICVERNSFRAARYYDVVRQKSDDSSTKLLSYALYYLTSWTTASGIIEHFMKKYFYTHIVI